ncbi:MAG TPA: hypothetical protein DCZ69_19000 [Syntrophobacteraceae bacterium]|jgi:hypothetical protein|nr:hypothetical protein [Syntrophobacteraceae bacterium]
MKDKRSLHLKVQELCDCYATADPLKGMSLLKSDSDKEEAALKWVALAVLHGLNDNAKRIVLERTDDGHVNVTAEYRKANLPVPDGDVATKIIAAVKDILHADGDKAEMGLALGVRDSSLDLHVKVKRDHGHEVMMLEFPN